MPNKWWQALQYVKYLCTARTKLYIHSPFVYALCEEVIYDRRWYYTFDDIELLRRRLLKNEKVIEVTDFGSGSQTMGKLRAIQDITRYAGTPDKVGCLLFKLMEHFKVEQALELGTSVGIGTLYLAMARPSGKVVTIEGCPQTADVAVQNFAVLKATNIESVIAPFDEALPLVLQGMPKLDLVFFDGNHNAKATLHYFNLCLPKVQDHTVFIFDDIYWSPDMNRAWEEVKQHPLVTVTIDLFRLGLVFFRKEQVKEHFKLYF